MEAGVLSIGTVTLERTSAEGKCIIISGPRTRLDKDI